MSLVTLPLVMVLLAMFSFGLGLLMAPLVVFFRDTGILLPYMMRIWMYVTPVMFTVTDIPRLGPASARCSCSTRSTRSSPCSSRSSLARWPSPGYLLLAPWPGPWARCWSAASSFLIRERDYAVRL